MANTLTKDLGVTILSPAIPGNPGSPPTPAYCVTRTETVYPVSYITLEDGTFVALPGSSYPVTTTTCYPATPGTPPTPYQPANVALQYNLGWNGGARSIASLAASGTASFSASSGMVGGVVGFDIGEVEFSYAGAEHALYFHHNLVAVLENGMLRTGAVPYVPADVFRIERSGTVVRYYQNTTLLYTSSTPSYGTQYLEASLYSGGDAVLNASLVATVTGGRGSGGATLLPLAARGGVLRNEGGAILAPLAAVGTGIAAQGGDAAFLPLGAVGSQGTYAIGRAELAQLTSTGEAGTAPTYALGFAPIGYLGAVGTGRTSGNTISPSNSLGDSTAGWSEHVWAGATVVIVSGTGAGQTRAIADNSGQALLVNTPWVTAPDATSVYEIRDALGNVLATGIVTPAGGAMRPLVALGSNKPYGGAVAELKPIKSYGTYVIPLKGWAFVEAPMATLSAAAHDSTGENAANITAPMATLSGYLGMGAKPKAPIAKLVASGTTQNWLTANVAGPAGTLSASATFAETIKGSVTAPMATLIGYGGMVASVTLTGSPRLTASITTGGVASTNIVGPMATLDLFEVTTEAFSTANIIAPMGEMGRTLQAWVLAPMARLDAVGTAVVAATYEAYAVNLMHRNTDTPVDETTRYTNFPFTHVVRYRNSYYGANSTGLYLLEGTTDDGAAIPWEFKTTITDFDSPMAKTAVSAYFSGRMGPAATVGIHLGESGDVSYSHSTPRGPAAQNYRQVFGLGLKSRYYALSVAGEGVMELDSVEFNTKTLTRRI